MKPFSLWIRVNTDPLTLIDLSDLNIHNDVRSVEDFLTSGRVEMFVEAMLQFYYRNYSYEGDEIESVSIYEPETRTLIKEFKVRHTVRQVFGLFETVKSCRNCLFQGTCLLCVGVERESTCKDWKNKGK